MTGVIGTLCHADEDMTRRVIKHKCYGTVLPFIKESVPCDSTIPHLLSAIVRGKSAVEVCVRVAQDADVPLLIL